jgi:Glycosyl hydrolase catalytic core
MISRLDLTVDATVASPTSRYGNPAPEAFKKQMSEIYEAYGSKYPLMITEFAVADWKAMKGSPEDNRFSKEQILKFMKAVLPWIEEQPWIAGYAWFPFSHESPQGTSSALFDADNRLTDLGRFYKSVTTEDPQGNQDI